MINPEQDFQEEQLLKKHRRFVNSGLFYKLPMRKLTQGDFVVIAKAYEGQVCQVSEVRGEEIELTVEIKDDGLEIRKVFPTDEVRHAEDYSNAYLKFIGMGKMIGVEIDGAAITRYIKAVDRNN